MSGVPASKYNCNNDDLSDCSKNDVKSDGDTETNINDNMADDSRKIFVGGLSWETNEEDLKKYFVKFGEVKSCVIKLDRFTNQSRGFGFVMFDSEDSVNKVLEQKEHILNKKKIDPKKAKPSREPQKKIFIGGLDPELQESKIKEYFSQFGDIENIETPFDVKKNKRKRYLFITFSNEAEARKAAHQESQEIDGKKFEVRVAIPRDQANRKMNMRAQYNNHGYPYPYYMYQDYLYSYLYNNPQFYNYFNPYEYVNYDLSRQFQMMMGSNNSTNLSASGNPSNAAPSPNNLTNSSPQNNAGSPLTGMGAHKAGVTGPNFNQSMYNKHAHMLYNNQSQQFSSAVTPGHDGSGAQNQSLQGFVNNAVNPAYYPYTLMYQFNPANAPTHMLHGNPNKQSPQNLPNGNNGSGKPGNDSLSES